MAGEVKNNLDTNNGYPFAHEKDVILQLLTELEILNGNAKANVGTNKGDNYLSDIRRVEASGKYKNGEDVQLRLIYKTVPGEEKRSDFMGVLFEREIFAYDVVLPTLERIETSANIDEAQRFLTPKCYKIIKEVGREAIVMEDVSAAGFVMVERRKAQDWTNVSIILTNLARLHALSYALRAREPKTFQKLSDQLKPDIFFGDENSLEKLPAFVELYETNFKSAQAALTNPEHSAMLEKLFNNRHEIITKLMSSQYAGSTAVVCHGDSWVNNIMFHHDKNGIPKKLCFVDWQIARHASPFVDIMYVIWTCTDEAFRNEHYDRLFEHYYSGLSKHLRIFGIEAENVYPKTQFLEDKKKYATHGLFVAIVLLPMLLSANIQFDDWETFDAKDICTKNELYVERMNGIVRDFVKFGDTNFSV